MSEALILDVGHGNCTIVRSQGRNAVVDAPLGAMLLTVLADLNIRVVDEVFISHADYDHLAGITSLLTSDTIEVKRVYVNPDGVKRSKAWSDFRAAVAVADSSGASKVISSLTTSEPGDLALGDLTIEVLAPSPDLALGGVGGETAGRRHTHNSLSAVLRVSKPGARGLLLAGDIDAIGFESCLEREVDLDAGVLVFPHHGGLFGSATETGSFAVRLLEVT